MPYTATPIPPDYDRPDIRLGQLMWLLNCSERVARRVVTSGKVKAWKLGGGILNIDLGSAKDLRARLLAAGLQSSPRPQIGKRPVGRPRKVAAEAVS
jgi:hypothetical protein